MKMKRILLATAAIAAISNPVFADMMENQIYVRGDIGGEYFPKFNSSIDAGRKESIKIKGKGAFGIDVGVGYYIMDNLRAELIYNHPFLGTLKGSKKTNDTPIVPAPATVDQGYLEKIEIKHKPTIHAAFVNIAGDVVDLGMGKLFIKGGIGWAKVRDSVTANGSGKVVVNPPVPAGGRAPAPVLIDRSVTYTVKSKVKNNVAFLIGGGGSFDVAEGVHLELGYTYRDYGKAKGGKNDKERVTTGSTHYKSHTVTAGVRFDI